MTPTAQHVTRTEQGTGSAALPRVFFFQPSIQHYRIPLWDAIIKRSEGRYEFSAIGPLQGGEAFGGGMRPYIRGMPEKRLPIPGFIMVRWPQALNIVRREKPDVVIMAANPRNITCWKLPKVCASVGAAIVAHSKVHSVSGVPQPIMKRVKQRFYRHIDFAICYGRQSRQELLGLGFPDQRIRVAQNTIDVARIFANQCALAARGEELKAAAGLAGKSVLLCIGRMEADKRHGDLLAAWTRLRELDPDLVMVLVSGGPMLAEIKERATQIDPDRIIVTGRVPEGDDYAWIAAADFTIYPGAVGLAINQSLALGKPTIIADEYGADAEILEHGVTGWRYRRGDLDALVQTVHQVMNDQPACSRVADNARRLMREHVTIDNMAVNFNATILEAIALSRTRRKT